MLNFLSEGAGANGNSISLVEKLPISQAGVVNKELLKNKELTLIVAGKHIDLG